MNPAGSRRPRGAPAASRTLAADHHLLLEEEVAQGNPLLSAAEQRRLREHHSTLARGDHPRAWVRAVYAARRQPAVDEIGRRSRPRVLDAGCGYGSDAMLFARAGARVLAVDRSESKIAVARKRLSFYEGLSSQPLDVTFLVADLDDPPALDPDLELTWMASVLAAIEDQEALLRRLYAATRPGGSVMITDMNLVNPWFFIGEWRRRRRAARSLPAFAEAADFSSMFWRRRRAGARFFPRQEGDPFDDVQFFWAGTLRRLLKKVGLEPAPAIYSGFVTPWMARRGLRGLEAAARRLPVLKSLGYFYLLAGRKPASAAP